MFAGEREKLAEKTRGELCGEPKRPKATLKGERERRGYSSGGRKIGELEGRTRGKVGGE